MKATFTKLNESNKIASHRKESAFTREIAAIDPKTGRAVVIARFYWPAQTCYACLWIHAEPHHARGAGKAGGGGYHKESTALESAAHDAGFTFDEYFGGCGDRAMRDAVESMARAVTGKRKFFIHEAHA